MIHVYSVNSSCQVHSYPLPLFNMAGEKLAKSAPILIVGAGVFGLSTALHLGQRGYTNVTVIDKQDYDKNLYSYDLGCDAASAGK